MRLGVGALGVVHVVGRDERQLELAREPHEDLVQDRLLRQPVVLKLDVEAPRLEARRGAREQLRALAPRPLRGWPAATSPPMQPVIATRPFERAAMSSHARRGACRWTCARETSQTRFL